MDLDPAAVAAGVGLTVFDTVGSTNAEALALARAGESGPLWVVARAQSAGRGRSGRAWSSEAGNLYATLLLVDPAPAERAAELSFVAALSVHDAIADVASALGPRLTLKWPNDVLCDGAKLSGILIEAEANGQGLFTAIGIGINCLRHPHTTDYPATDIVASGAYVTGEAVFRALSRRMLLRIAQWRRGADFASIRADWIRRAAGIGEPVRVRLRDREMMGHFEALDEHGRLVLRRADGTTETITAGDVFPVSQLAAAERA